MSYQVLARKYRPQRFSDVVGQEHVTQTLANAIRQHRIAHAYLFVGPRGTGKTTLARIFAKCLNCTGGPKVDFADDDPRCQEITEGRALDVLEIDGASNRGIEEIRELRETVKYAPATSRFKIYIIDEVHMLTKEAFNALLKTLEEPPDHVKFMFATTEAEKVLPTILSRCQRFDLRRIPTALIVQHLGHIAKQENVKIEEAALYAIARGAEGGMRDAESTLDQLISFCGGEIVEADVLSMFGLSARSQILALARAVIAGESETALRELNDLAKNGKDLGRLLSDLLSHFRNLLLFQVSRGDLNLLEVSEAEASALKEMTTSIDTDSLTRIMEVLTEGESRLRDAASKKILVEVTLLKAIQAKNAVSVELVLKKLQSLKGDANIASSVTPNREAAPALAAAAPTAKSASVAPARVAEAAVMKPEAPAAALPRIESAPAVRTAADLPQLWQNTVEAVGRVSPFTKTYLLEAHPVSLIKNIFTIGFDPEFADHVGLVDNSKNRALIQTKLQELGAGEVHVKFIVSQAPANWQRIDSAESPTPTATGANPVPPPAFVGNAAENQASSKSAREELKNDPLIRQALELFKGTIIEVRT
ncbi:MAG: DNA polymerase III subunit gamma/tau [Verrucomicrobia bacterium]|nr:DNA polymerase III subunit gamma/tau [Verrucomicrobiota bacterium]